MPRFILATTDPHKIPATVLSRCQRFDFRRIPAPEIAAHLKHIATAEGFEAEPDALLAIARSAQGCMRDAVSLLDQMLAYGSTTVTLLQVQQVLGAVNAQAVAELVDALAAKNTGRGLALIHKLVTDGASLMEFCQQVIEYLRGVMVIQMTGDASLLDDLTSEAIQQIQQQARQLQLPNTLFAIKRFSEAIPELKGGYQPQLPLELAFIEGVQGGPVAPVIVQQVVQAQGSTAAPAVVAAPQAMGKPPAAPESKGLDVVESASPRSEPARLDVDAAKRLHARWKDFQAQVKIQCGANVVAALNAVRDIAVTEQAVAFAFGNNEFSRGMVAKPEVLAKVAAVLTTFLGRAVALECQIGEKAIIAGRVVTVVDEKSTGPDPLVEFAVNDLGAQVIDKAVS